MNKLIIIFTIIASLVSCMGHSGLKPIDQFPMYGGMNRSDFPKLIAADEKLIADTTAHFGSREKASMAFADQGFRFYLQDELVPAMRRFNQAWLLNPSNAEAYWGFGSVLHDQDKDCEALSMLDRAFALNYPKNKGFYPDAAFITTLCAAKNSSASSDEKNKLFERSEKLFREGEKTEPNKAYLYNLWAKAKFWQNDYSEAWRLLAKVRAVGGLLDQEFISILTEKMPPPKDM